MKRKSAYPYKGKGKPGETVHYLRLARDWSQRELADRCEPPLDHTTVRRIENNDGYTKDSLTRVAKALSVKTEELFYPKEVADVMIMPKTVRNEIFGILESMLKIYRKK